MNPFLPMTDVSVNYWCLMGSFRLKRQYFVLSFFGRTLHVKTFFVIHWKKTCVEHFLNLTILLCTLSHKYEAILQLFLFLASSRIFFYSLTLMFRVDSFPHIVWRMIEVKVNKLLYSRQVNNWTDFETQPHSPHNFEKWWTKEIRL